MNLTKLVILCLIFSLIISGCGDFSPTTPIRVIYFVQDDGQLPQVELSKYQEILVINNFNEFKRASGSRSALWIDKNAVQLLEKGWLNTMPQASYPIILIGYNDTLFSFRDVLRLCCFLGPIISDRSGIESGFSVIMRESGELGAPIIMMQGFQETPMVNKLLQISVDLLDGKIIPTAIPSPAGIFATLTSP